jgi:hypothetical protein
MASKHRPFVRRSRREFLKTVGGGAGAVLTASTAHAHHHPRPWPQSLPYLDQRTYIHNMEVIAHLPEGRAGQMMAIGSKRFLFSGRNVLDVSDPRDPKMVNSGGGQNGQLAYNATLKKWILLSSSEAPRMVATPFGKYEDAKSVAEFKNFKGLRGLRMWDATDPTNIVLLSEYSTGQTGSGVHIDGTYYDGGKYAFLAAAPDDSFTHLLSCILPLSHCLMIVDVSDPTNVKPVANWWVPGQRNTEVEEFKKWKVVQGRLPATLGSTKTLDDVIKTFPELKYPALDRMPYTQLHGPVCVPKKIEDGGTRGYGAWSAFGFMIHDLSEITKPRVIGRFDPTPTYGMDGIPFHTIWVGTLDRGFVVTVSEALNPDCNESSLPLWVVDVRDETNPISIAQLPRPVPPAEAPFTDYCFARGRFSAHICPPLQAPGRPSQTFFPVSFFNAGLRCYDLSEPTQPKEVAYFVPPHGGDISNPLSFNRPTENVTVEWDRNIIYVGSTTGLYVLTCPALGEPTFESMPVSQWSLPGLNAGAP